jgi:hypothetical protein
MTTPEHEEWCERVAEIPAATPADEVTRERDVIRGDLKDWAEGTLAEWLPTYHQSKDGTQYRVVAQYDGSYLVEYSDINRKCVGRYTISLEVKDANQD